MTLACRSIAGNTFPLPMIPCSCTSTFTLRCRNDTSSYLTIIVTLLVECIYEIDSNSALIPRLFAITVPHIAPSQARPKLPLQSKTPR
jgi:hypothetical protein